jgi:hypothetical protein
MHRKRRMLAVLPLAALSLLVFAALAFAAFHTTNGSYHGIGSSTGGGVGAGLPMSYSQHNLYDVEHIARMYHVYDNGVHNQQCSAGPTHGAAFCYGNWGTAPCQKRAYTQSFIVGIGDQSGWHWMRGASCAGQTHQ